MVGVVQIMENFRAMNDFKHESDGCLEALKTSSSLGKREVSGHERECTEESFKN